MHNEIAIQKRTDAASTSHFGFLLEKLCRVHKINLFYLNLSVSLFHFVVAHAKFLSIQEVCLKFSPSKNAFTEIFSKRHGKKNISSALGFVVQKLTRKKCSASLI